MSDRALVRNAADPRQVRRAERRQRTREALLLEHLRDVLEAPTVRFVVAEILDRAGLYATVFDHSGSLMYFKEGRRNFGLELRALCEAASPERTDQMDRERRARQAADDRETDAGHIASATEDTTT